MPLFGADRKGTLTCPKEPPPNAALGPQEGSFEGQGGEVTLQKARRTCDEEFVLLVTKKWARIRVGKS